MSQPVPYQPAPHPSVTYAPAAVAPKNPGLSLLASFFVPGLGSLVAGRFGWGAVIFAAYVVAWLSMFVLIGFLLVPVVWIWGMADAYLGAKSWNSRHGIIS